MHLVIDGYGGNGEQMSDEALVRSFLDTYPQRIGMTKISPPYVCTYRGAKAEDWGVSGFVLIAESHISIHTFPHRGYLNADIFSCKAFDAAQAVADLKAAFNLERTQSHILRRGVEYQGLEDSPSAALLEQARKGSA